MFIRILLAIGCCAIFNSICQGQPYTGRPEASKYIRSSDLAVLTPNIEHYNTLQFIKYGIPRDDRPFTKVFSLYSVPTEERESVYKLLKFAVYSLSAGFVRVPPKPVPNSDTLFYIDIRDYNWNNEAWELIAQEDPYFQEPWINDEDAAELLELAGNALVNGAWFIAHLLDPIKQDDVGRDELYYELLYSNLGGPPVNLAEFAEIWGVDADRVNDFQLAIGTIVEKGKSSVARNERQLARVGVDTGYYYETSDQKTNQFKYIDNLDPVLGRNDRDAAEAIATNFLGYQVYWLAAFVNGVEQRVEFADPTVAVDTSTNTDDIRVRMVRSCVVCHTKGLNEGDNHFQRLLKSGTILKVEDFNLRNILEDFYNNDFNAYIKNDRQIYVNAVQRDIGWTTEKLVHEFATFMAWYDRPLDIEQAAREAGITVDGFRNYLISSPSGILDNLVLGGTVPRDVWEEGDDSAFVETMLSIYRVIFAENDEAFDVQEFTANNSLFGKDIVDTGLLAQQVKDTQTQIDKLRKQLNLNNNDSVVIRNKSETLKKLKVFEQKLENVSKFLRHSYQDNNKYFYFKNKDGKIIRSIEAVTAKKTSIYKKGCVPVPIGRGQTVYILSEEHGFWALIAYGINSKWYRGFIPKTHLKKTWQNN